jgi:mRNA-degrading endonuclease toxin of MazEF toxin-antitoxin module
VAPNNIVNQRRVSSAALDARLVVVPLSSSPRASLPLLVAVHCAGRDVVAVTDQIRTVSKERLEGCLGTLSPEHLEVVERGVRDVPELR